MRSTENLPGPVGEKFIGYSPEQREVLLNLRALILEVASEVQAGRIEETLKWGQPSYLTPETRSGTTIRIDAHPGGGVALYVNCQTSLVETYRAHYPALSYEGTRAVVFAADEPLPLEPLRHIVALALTYHARKKGAGAPIRDHR